MADEDELFRFLATLPTHLHYTEPEFDDELHYTEPEPEPEPEPEFDDELHNTEPEPEFDDELHYSEPEFDDEQLVFWSQIERSQNNSSSDDPGIPDPSVIQEKIESAFSEVENEYYFEGLIQFWAPVTTGGGRRLLTTSYQPFVLKNLDTCVDEYRIRSLKYQYDIDVNKLEVEENPMIISGAPASAFLNRLPEVVLDLRVHQGCPLVRSALECQLRAYFVLPICDPSQSCCVGVVECSMDDADAFLPIFNELNKALMRVGLSTFHVQECLPYKTIHGLKPARDEIEEALEIVFESLPLTLAQVWIAYEDDNHVPFPSSLEDTQTKRMLAIKLIGYVDSDDDLHSSFMKYHDICVLFPLKLGKGLAGRTLQNYCPHFCKDTSKLNNNELVPLLPTYAGYSCLVICLRSIDTDDFDYAFEFLWPKHRNYVIFLESLFLTLKRCLPSFKFACGAELGDELCVLDFENSTGSEIGFFKIFQGNRLSPIPKASEEGRRPVVEERIAPLEAKCKTTPIPLPQAIMEQQFGRTMKEAAKNLNVSLSTLKRKCKVYGISEWQGPNRVKRKIDRSYKNQRDMNEEYNGAIQDPSAVNGETHSDEHTLTIRAEYAGDTIKFLLPISLATFVAVEKEIDKRFKLIPANYKLKYLDEDGCWILITCDEDMTVCIKNRTAITLHLLPSALQISGQTSTYQIT